ncbi:MAG: exosortase-associated EpsI family protein, partial [Nitrospirota bacterium]|nr:exosortase-associated EpsI family protein [Nitrospirota bacterium]
WGRFYLVRDALTLHRTDGALVRLSMPLHGTVEKTVETELSFVQSLTPILARYIPGRRLGQKPGPSRDKNFPEVSAHGTF